MEWTKIALIIVAVGLIITIIIKELIKTNIDKIMLEDSLKINLHKPLLIKSYNKIFRTKFEPYIIPTTSKFNKKIFDQFNKDMEDIKKLQLEEEVWWDIVFINKINGFIEETAGMYTLLTEDSGEYFTDDKHKIELIKEFYEEQFDHIKEISISGIYNINKKQYILEDLSLIRIFTNKIKGKDKITVMFLFGVEIETLTFNSIKNVYDFLFENRNSDIRLIEKISNSSISLIEVM